MPWRLAPRHVVAIMTEAARLAAQLGLRLLLLSLLTGFGPWPGGRKSQSQSDLCPAHTALRCPGHWHVKQVGKGEFDFSKPEGIPQKRLSEYGLSGS